MTEREQYKIDMAFRKKTRKPSIRFVRTPIVVKKESGARYHIAMTAEAPRVAA
jgi:hypothetical protein